MWITVWRLGMLGRNVQSYKFHKLNYFSLTWSSSGFQYHVVYPEIRLSSIQGCQYTGVKTLAAFITNKFYAFYSQFSISMSRDTIILSVSCSMQFLTLCFLPCFCTGSGKGRTDYCSKVLEIRKEWCCIRLGTILHLAGATPGADHCFDF